MLKSRLLAIVLLQGYAPRLGCRHWAAAAETVGTAAAAAVAATEVAAEVESGGSSPKNFVSNELRAPLLAQKARRADPVSAT